MPQIIIGLFTVVSNGWLINNGTYSSKRLAPQTITFSTPYKTKCYFCFGHTTTLTIQQYADGYQWIYNITKTNFITNSYKNDTAYFIAFGY